MTAALGDCLAKARDASDANLNSVYQHVKSKLDAANADRLIQTQRVWIKYRDANCSAERELYAGGTASTLLASKRSRTKDLQVTYAIKLKD